MPVLPKYQLKQLFESGDLLTQTTLNELIEASYNPTLVAGSNVVITKTESPSGATIIISSAGGGGGAANVTAGDGISVTTVGDNAEVAVDLDNSQTNLIFNGSNKLTFAGLHIKDEGIAVGTYKTINFIGNDVLAEDSGTPGQVNVYIPTPTFASHFNKTDGTTTGTVSEGGITRSTVRISSPTVEGSPFKTNGWAGTNKPVYTGSSAGTVVFTTAQVVTGFSGDSGGDATITVTVYDADGTSVLETYTTPTLYQNGVYSSIGNRISVTITLYQADTSKWKAAVSISVQAGNVLSNNGLDGGRYHVKATMDTDTATDGGGSHSYTQADVFFDTNPSTPAINGAVTIVESTTPSNILTKHLSGVEYYILNSQFEIDVTDIDNFNANTQGRAGAAQWNFRIIGSEYGLPTRQLEAWSLAYGTWNGTWTNTYSLVNAAYEYTSWPITDTNYRFRNSTTNGSSTVYDPWNTGNTVNSPNQAVLIDTHTVTSTSLGEDFDDESQRLTRGSSAYSTFNSTATLGTSLSNQTGSSGPFSDGCVVGSYLVRADKFFADNGDSPAIATLIPNLTGYKPNKGGTNPNYSSYSQVPTYHRKFYTASGKAIANFNLTAGGTWGSSGSLSNALNSSSIKMYVRRVGSSTGGSFGFNANPLALHGAMYNSGAPINPFNDGSSGVDTVGSLIRTAPTPPTGNNTVTGTFGAYSCDDGFWLEIQIIDPDIKIDFINVTLLFTDGSNESNPV
jgi:hypothetical protein